MAKQKGGSKPSNGTQNGEGEETVSGYFRRVFAEEPKLLDTRSNDELLARWLKDHPGQTEVPERVRQNLSNIKSVLRKGARKRGKQKQQRAEAAGTPPKVLDPRPTLDALAGLEEQIDDALTLAK